MDVVIVVSSPEPSPGPSRAETPPVTVRSALVRPVRPSRVVGPTTERPERAPTARPGAAEASRPVAGSSRTPESTPRMYGYAVREPKCMFPWVDQFYSSAQWKMWNKKQNMENLMQLVNLFIRLARQPVREVYSKPMRASKLKNILSSHISLFSTMFKSLKKDGQRDIFQRKFSNIVVMYVDAEMSSFRTGKSDKFEVASKITSVLFTYLFGDHSHIVCTLIRCRSLSTQFFQVWNLVFRKILKIPPAERSDTKFLLNILAYKIWRIVSKDKIMRREITRLAKSNLKVPENFVEKCILAGVIPTVLPKMPKRFDDLVSFVMMMKYDVRKKIQEFFILMEKESFLSQFDDPWCFSEIREHFKSEIKVTDEERKHNPSECSRVMVRKQRDDIFNSKEPGTTDIHRAQINPIIEIEKCSTDKRDAVLKKNPASKAHSAGSGLPPISAITSPNTLAYPQYVSPEHESIPGIMTSTDPTESYNDNELPNNNVLHSVKQTGSSDLLPVKPDPELIGNPQCCCDMPKHCNVLYMVKKSECCCLQPDNFPPITTVSPSTNLLPSGSIVSNCNMFYLVKQSEISSFEPTNLSLKTAINNCLNPYPNCGSITGTSNELCLERQFLYSNLQLKNENHQEKPSAEESVHNNAVLSFDACNNQVTETVKMQNILSCPPVSGDIKPFIDPSNIAETKIGLTETENNSNGLKIYFQTHKLETEDTCGKQVVDQITPVQVPTRNEQDMPLATSNDVELFFNNLRSEKSFVSSSEKKEIVDLGMDWFVGDSSVCKASKVLPMMEQPHNMGTMPNEDVEAIILADPGNLRREVGVSSLVSQKLALPNITLPNPLSGEPNGDDAQHSLNITVSPHNTLPPPVKDLGQINQNPTIHLPFSDLKRFINLGEGSSITLNNDVTITPINYPPIKRNTTSSNLTTISEQLGVPSEQTKSSTNEPQEQTVRRRVPTVSNEVPSIFVGILNECFSKIIHTFFHYPDEIPNFSNDFHIQESQIPTSVYACAHSITGGLYLYAFGFTLYVQNARLYFYELQEKYFSTVSSQASKIDTIRLDSRFKSYCPPIHDLHKRTLERDYEAYVYQKTQRSSDMDSAITNMQARLIDINDNDRCTCVFCSGNNMVLLANYQNFQKYHILDSVYKAVYPLLSTQQEICSQNVGRRFNSNPSDQCTVPQPSLPLKKRSHVESTATETSRVYPPKRMMSIAELYSSIPQEDRLPSTKDLGPRSWGLKPVPHSVYAPQPRNYFYAPGSSSRSRSDERYQNLDPPAQKQGFEIAEIRWYIFPDRQPYHTLPPDK